MEFSIFVPGHWFDLSTPPKRLYHELLEQGELAEELGFDSVWLAEHHFNNYVAQPGPFQLAAMLGERTKTVNIGIAVVVLTFHHPLRLAGELAQLDVLLDGRLEAALGRGAFPWEAHQMGIVQTQAESREYCREHIKVMATTLRSRGAAIDYEGERWSFSNLTIIPPTATDASPRFWVAAQRPDSVEWAVSSALEAGLPPIVFCSQLRRPFSLIEGMAAAFKESIAAHEAQGTDTAGGFLAYQPGHPLGTDDGAGARRGRWRPLPAQPRRLQHAGDLRRRPRVREERNRYGDRAHGRAEQG